MLLGCRSAAWDNGIVVVPIPLLRGGVVTSIPSYFLLVQASSYELASGYSACQRMEQSSVVDAGQVAMQMQTVDVPAPLSESDWIEQKNGNWRSGRFTARSETNEEGI